VIDVATEGYIKAACHPQRTHEVVSYPFYNYRWNTLELYETYRDALPFRDEKWEMCDRCESDIRYHSSQIWQGNNSTGTFAVAVFAVSAQQSIFQGWIFYGYGGLCVLAHVALVPLDCSDRQAFCWYSAAHELLDDDNRGAFDCDAFPVPLDGSNKFVNGLELLDDENRRVYKHDRARPFLDYDNKQVSERFHADVSQDGAYSYGDRLACVLLCLVDDNGQDCVFYPALSCLVYGYNFALVHVFGIDSDRYAVFPVPLDVYDIHVAFPVPLDASGVPVLAHYDVSLPLVGSCRLLRISYRKDLSPIFVLYYVGRIQE